MCAGWAAGWAVEGCFLSPWLFIRTSGVEQALAQMALVSIELT